MVPRAETLTFWRKYLIVSKIQIQKFVFTETILKQFFRLVSFYVVK